VGTKPRLATVSLAGCFGCHMSLLDIDDRLLRLIQQVDFDCSPFVDHKQFVDRCAVGLIEGGCCVDQQVEVLREFRRRCDVLVSCGACANHGNIPALRNTIPVRECLEEAFVTGPTVYEPSARIPSDPELPLLLDRVYPAHEVVHIDEFLPGCPPSADAIWLSLQQILAGRPIQLPYQLLKYD
jgi:NAD-reducing hydrogenase small subunit